MSNDCPNTEPEYDTPDMCPDCLEDIPDCCCPDDPDPDDNIRLYGSIAALDRIGEPSLRRAA